MVHRFGEDHCSPKIVGTAVPSYKNVDMPVWIPSYGIYRQHNKLSSPDSYHSRYAGFPTR